MRNYISLIIAMCFGGSVNSQNGACLDYRITSSKGINGTIKLSYSEFGSIMEFNMMLPQMPDRGIITKNLSQKNEPEVMYTINDRSKTYTETTKKASAKEDTKTYVVKKIGEEQVNGYKCIHALVTEGTETTEVWNTKDVAEYSKYAEGFYPNKKMGAQKRDEALKAAGCDGLPVKTIHKGNDKEGEMTLELVKIEKKTYNKLDFEIPEGYTKDEPGASKNGEEKMGMAEDQKTGGAQMKTQEEIKNMTPAERNKYIEEMKKKYGK